jgi:hypothetical protein
LGVRRTASEALRSSYVAVEESEVIRWRLKVWEDIKPSQTFLRPDSLSFKKLLHQNAKIGQTCSAVHPPAGSQLRFRSNLPPQAPRTRKQLNYISISSEADLRNLMTTSRSQSWDPRYQMIIVEVQMVWEKSICFAL